MIRHVLFVVSSFLLCMNIAFADVADVKKVKVVTPEFYNGANKHGEGFYFDIMQVIYKPLNINIEYEIMPYSRALNMIETKQADAIFSIYSAKLIKEMTKKDGLLTPKRAVTIERLSAIFSKKAQIQWQGMRTLKNKKVAWIRGYNYQYFLNVPVQMEELSSYDQIFPLLERGRIDFYIDALSDISHTIEKYNIDVTQYEVGDIVAHNLYIGFSDTPTSEYLIALFDQRINELDKSGQLDKIYKKWGFESPDLSITD